MDLQTIELPRAEARERFVEYRRAVHQRHDAEDEAIMRGYRAMAKGSALISLQAAISAGGVDEHQRPRIAVGKATAEKVFLERRGADGSVMFSTKLERASNNAIDVRPFPAGTLPSIDLDGVDWSQREAKGVVQGGWNGTRFSVMPNVPPRFRPAKGLHLYDVLFEVDEWAKEAPPVTKDPALLRHLAGDLYVVCAVWDLTELERLVLAGRAR